MTAKQVSIFLENRAGRLAEVTRLLGDRGINIRALSLADTADFGILRILVNDVETAVALLKQEGLTVRQTDVVAAEVPDRPGGLAHLLEILSGEGINVEYMYAFVRSRAESAIMIFRFDETQKAVEVLSRHGVRILPEDELYRM
ncbi:MAG: ACT domain-containing protein [bacterium]